MEELEEVIGELKSITRNESDYFGKIFDCFIYSSNLYLVMEYFENGSLMDAVGPNHSDNTQEAYLRVRVHCSSCSSHQVSGSFSSKEHRYDRYKAIKLVHYRRWKNKSLQLRDEPTIPE